jgi:hypothetical protein
MNAWHNAVLALILASCSAHAEEWKAADYKLLAAATTLLVVDWGQTRDLTRTYTETSASLNGQAPLITRTRTHRETNPLLGDNPSIGDVDKYFAGALLLTAGLSYALPAKYRRYFLGGVIVLESVIVARNHHIGLRVDF